MPQSDKATDRVGIHFQDHVGVKLNYYLNQTVHLGQAVCRADGQATYGIGVDLTSTVPANPAKTLSPSITGEWKAANTQPGVRRMYAYVYAPPGSEIAGAIVNGAVVDVTKVRDESYPVARLLVAIAPGATITMAVDLVAEKAGIRALEAVVTPVVHNTPIVPTPLDCATVPGI